MVNPSTDSCGAEQVGPGQRPSGAEELYDESTFGHRSLFILLSPTALPMVVVDRCIEVGSQRSEAGGCLAPMACLVDVIGVEGLPSHQNGSNRIS